MDNKKNLLKTVRNYSYSKSSYIKENFANFPEKIESMINDAIKEELILEKNGKMTITQKGIDFLKKNSSEENKTIKKSKSENNVKNTNNKKEKITKSKSSKVVGKKENNTKLKSKSVPKNNNKIDNKSVGKKVAKTNDKKVVGKNDKKVDNKKPQVIIKTKIVKEIKPVLIKEIRFTKYEKAIIRIFLDTKKESLDFKILFDLFQKKNKIIFPVEKMESQLILALKRCVKKGFMIKRKNIYKLSSEINNYAKSFPKEFKNSYEFAPTPKKEKTTENVAKENVEGTILDDINENETILENNEERDEEEEDQDEVLETKENEEEYEGQEDDDNEAVMSENE